MNPLDNITMKRFVLPAGLLLGLLTATLPAFAGTPLDKTVATTANGHVQISSVAGSIKVTAWNRDQIHVGGTLSRDAQRLAVEKTADGVSIRVVLPPHTSGNMEGSHLIIQLPAASQLEVHTVSADIDASGLGMLVFIQKRAKEQGLSTNLRHAPERVRNLLKLTMLEFLFEFGN